MSSNDLKYPLLDPLSSAPRLPTSSPSESNLPTSSPTARFSCKKKWCILAFVVMLAGSAILFETSVPHGLPPKDPGPIHFDNSTDDDVDNISSAPTPTPATSSPTATPRASCSNNIKDGSETDVDCGGSDCFSCPPGSACLVSSDCLGTCSNEVCIASSSPTPAPTVCSSQIKISASAFKSTHAILWLYNSEDSWNVAKDRCSDSAYIHMAKEINVETGAFSLDVPLGDYAAMIIDDANNNGKLDKNWMGVPNEGCGASNGAKGGPLGGPPWSDAKFSLTECGTKAEVPISLWSM
mmetsp:Transcript_23163/g.48091  ORF Transcript_23163/g.48091 Transcript_23163/m.48091 type:complete len:295 (+) Transcript_23163:58-942(+)|eukprot:CAMPEP_0197550080 /NCGR_PEP_ID=MMETSP1320-20131121/3791_1 /TAXON_ID=91990 /ORGANISM="Bolidomonas sp., Strain RCC2347" /LENGTH=294 /DNA_ID=CAMNT_0043110401 /DNA_START=50 /DNA_END=934 /DNA_ORIENTATION=-